MESIEDVKLRLRYPNLYERILDIEKRLSLLELAKAAGMKEPVVIDVVGKLPAKRKKA